MHVEVVDEGFHHRCTFRTMKIHLPDLGMYRLILENLEHEMPSARQPLPHSSEEDFRSTSMLLYVYPTLLMCGLAAVHSTY